MKQYTVFLKTLQLVAALGYRLIHVLDILKLLFINVFWILFVKKKSFGLKLENGKIQREIQFTMFGVILKSVSRVAVVFEL